MRIEEPIGSYMDILIPENIAKRFLMPSISRFSDIQYNGLFPSITTGYNPRYVILIPIEGSFLSKKWI